MSQTIILIRHGEKPGGEWHGLGLNEEGLADDESLIVRGWQRAGGLALLFSGRHEFDRPDRIYASGEAKQDGTGSRSKRPLQTIAPIARKLGLIPATTFTKGQEAQLSAQLTSLSGVTLVSWQHQSIPLIAQAILGSDQAALPPWPDTSFDLVWTLTRASETAVWMFTQRLQQLLAGDMTA